ncbi:MAG TPA: methyl-accepting chemotaxis protein [Polyangiales bacterium]|nr:methyl-accepting chemotaxis protein [Polyangiales bacterium]
MSKRRRVLARVLESVRPARSSAARPALDEAVLLNCHERAARAAEVSMSTCQAAGATAAQQRTSLDGAVDHARLLLSRSRDIKSAADRVRESLDRAKLIALNAGLEGARLGESVGRPLVSVADEMRSVAARGLDALAEHLGVLDQVDRERERLRDYVEQARQVASQLADELLRAQSAQRESVDALAAFAEYLQKATGTDPETARAVSEARDHVRGLSGVLSQLPSEAQRELLLRVLGPSLAPLRALLGEIDREPRDDPGSR